jgi:hypothetical protein
LRYRRELGHSRTVERPRGGDITGYGATPAIPATVAQENGVECVADGEPEVIGVLCPDHVSQRISEYLRGVPTSVVVECWIYSHRRASRAGAHGEDDNNAYPSGC